MKTQKSEKNDEDIQNLNIKLAQKEETIKYFLDLIKQITNMIEDFYKENLDNPIDDDFKENGISFGGIISKLKYIFDLYKNKKNDSISDNVIYKNTKRFSDFSHVNKKNSSFLNDNFDREKLKSKLSPSPIRNIFNNK